MIHITSHKDVKTFPVSCTNAITEEYYNHLVCEINNYNKKCAVAKIENRGLTSYHNLILP